MLVHKHYDSEIAGQMADFRTKGQKEAAAHRPPTDATRPDHHEAGLRSQAEKWLNTEQLLFDSELTEAGRTALEVRQKAVELQTRVEQMVSDESLLDTIETEMSAERNALVAATEARMRAEVDWKAFRAANNITEQAVYPESHIWHFAIVLVFAFVETAVNAFFFENAQGLLGGFVVALGVSAINMLGAMVLGMGFRFKNLAAWDKKAFGWFCAIAFVILSLYCNALFSAFRAEYQLLADPSDTLLIREAFSKAATEASQLFVLQMHIADLMSFILFGVGLLLSGLAFWKGYTFDDRHPGYGKKDRAVKKAQQTELEKQDLLRQKVKEFLHRYRAEVQAAIHEPQQLISRVTSRSAGLQHAVNLLNTQAQAIQRDYELVLGAYRQANTAVRATHPPAYFKVIDDLKPLVSGAAAAGTLSDLAQAQAEIGALRERHEDPLNKKLKELQGNATTVLNHNLTAFLREIEADAQERINRLVLTIHRDVAAAEA